MDSNTSSLAIVVKKTQAVMTSEEIRRGLAVNNVMGIILCRCCNLALKVRIFVNYSVNCVYIYPGCFVFVDINRVKGA